MYNGIGLTTPRGSGTNGHVQRNWAFVRPGKKDNTTYKAEDDIQKLDASLNRPPNKEILDHDRKRKIEVKCIEFEEILEKQGRTPEEIKAKVDSYRQKLMGQGKTDLPKDEFGRIAVRETHKIAEAQQEKNAKLREAFNISEYFVEGSSFDSDRKSKEDLAKSLALQKELDAQREAAAATAAAGRDKEKRYALVRTPSKEKEVGGGGDEREHVSKSERKKKKKRSRDSSASPERKKDKKKKSKKHKKESKVKKRKAHKRKNSDTDSQDSDKDIEDDEGACSDSDHDVKKRSKRNKKDKKKRDKKKKKERSNSTDASKASSPTRRLVQKKSHKSAPQIEQDRIAPSSKRPTKNPFRSRSREKEYSPQASSSNTSVSRPVLSQREVGRSRYDPPDRSTSRRRSKSFERYGERRRDRSIEKRSERKRKPSEDRLRSRQISPVLEKRKRYTRSRSHTSDRISLSSRRKQSPNRRENRRSPPRRDPFERSRNRNTSRSRSRSTKRPDHKSSNRSYSSRSRSTTQGRRERSGTPPPRRREQEKSPLLAPAAAKKPPHFNPFKAKDAEVMQVLLEPKTALGRNSANPFKTVEPTKKVDVDLIKRPSRRSPSSSSSTESSSGSEHSRSRTPAGKLRKISKERSFISDTRSRSARSENVSKATLSAVQKSTDTHKRQSRSRSDLKNRDQSHNGTRSRSFTRSRDHKASRSLSRSRNRRKSPRLSHSRSRTNSRERKTTRSSYRKRTRTPESIQRGRSHTPVNVLRKSRTPTRSKDNIKPDLKPEKSPVKSETLNVAPKSETNAMRAESRSHSSHNSSELSYSPAIRNPERYRDILEQVEKDKHGQQKENASKDKRNISDCPEKAEQKIVEKLASREPEQQQEKNDKAERERDHRGEKEKKESRRERNSRDAKETTSRQRTAVVPAPVVRLQGQSEDESDSDNVQSSITKKTDGPDNLDEFQDNKREQLKDLKMLEQLKSGLAAKAKEKIKTIEKMAATSTSLSEPLVAALADSTLVDTIVSKVSTATVAAAESAARRSRSRSRRSSRNRDRNRDGTSRRSTSRSRSSHYSSSSSRSRSRSSRSHSRSRSRTSHSSCSSRSSSGSSSSSSSGTSRTGSRSPSIPRRRGSPSFLDRRRITSARKRPIPYHRKTPSDASSVCSSYFSRESSPSTIRSPTRSRSASFAC